MDLEGAGEFFWKRKWNFGKWGDEGPNGAARHRDQSRGRGGTQEYIRPHLRANLGQKIYRTWGQKPAPHKIRLVYTKEKSFVEGEHRGGRRLRGAGNSY